MVPEKESMRTEGEKKSGSETQYSEDYKKVRQGALENDIKYCDKLKDYGRDNCIYDIASVNNNKELCAAIENAELRKKCDELMTSREAIAAEDISGCLNINDDYSKEQCLVEIFKKYNNTKQCAVLVPDIKNKCLNIVYGNISLREGDSKICENINDNGVKSDCQLAATNKPKDSDNDGLLDSQELSYGTNAFSADTDSDGLNDLDELSKYFTDPNNPDTDTDGHKDGDEVKKGFNPNGPGKLEAGKK